MKLMSVLLKSLREQMRDLLGLSLSLAFAPFFVLIYWAMFPSGSTTYGVLVLNQDSGIQASNGSTMVEGDALVEALRGVSYPDGKPLLKVGQVESRADAENRLRNRDAAALLVIPEGFSRSLDAARSGSTEEGARVTIVGDLANPYYAVAAVMATGTVDAYVQRSAELTRPVGLIEEPLGASGARSEFENYVPGLLVFAVILLLFQAAMVVAREVEAGTLRRLKLTRMSSFDYLGGVSASLVVVGSAAVLLTFATAWALGFHSQGPLWVAVVVGAATTLSVIGVGLVVACFCKTVVQAFLIANFPLGLFMFFSGAIYPIPRLPIASIGDRTVGLYDVLPPTHAVVALNKVLTLGAGIGDVTYELGALLVLSALYFGAGVWLFRRTHLGSW
jgi:ABC-2 type transport system permease protein